MLRIERLGLVVAAGCALGLGVAAAAAAAPEWNPVRTHRVSIGPEANRLVVGFRATTSNALVKGRQNPVAGAERQAGSGANVSRGRVEPGTTQRRDHRQVPPADAEHARVLSQKTLYGVDVNTALDALRADSSVEFAEVDQRRYPQAIPPSDPLFMPTAGASGQWYLQTPSTATATSDAAATDAVSAWAITTGSSGTVIADVDTGVRFEHPDLLRAGLRRPLAASYDFVEQDYNATSGAALGTFLIANDGDGWDPDPSDPGDWINSADLTHTSVFPSTNCDVGDSSWHGTRVMGILGALTDNDVGIAGMTWNPYILPVRALGKCGGYDSDIIAGIQWAVGGYSRQPLSR